LPYPLSKERIMRILLCGLVLGMLALTAAADTDITGKWAGKFDVTTPAGETKSDTAFLVLTQNGSEVKGTVGPNESEQFPIAKGKIEGEKITLQVEHEGHTIKFDLVLAADRITGEANMSRDEGTAKAKVDVERVK
jgi:hypothetical protein